MQKRTAEQIVQVYAILSGLWALAAIGLAMMMFTTGYLWWIGPDDYVNGFGLRGYTYSVILFITGIATLITIYGLWTHRKWARIATIIVNLVGFLNIAPVTIINVIVICLFAFNKDIKTLFK